MRESKKFYRDNAPEGWDWVGFDGCYHEYSKGNYNDGFKVVRCYESEILDGSLALLIKLGRTR